MTDYLLWSIFHLGALGLMLLCAAGLGNLFLRKHRFANLLERLVFITALGLGLCALLLFFLGLLGLLYRYFIQALTGAGALATVLSILYPHRRSLGIRSLKKLLSVRDRKVLFTLRNAVVALLILLAVSCAILLIISSQYPPTNWDSISNHLVIARANLRQHRLVVVWGIPQPVLPLLNHMLFTWAMAIQDDVLAQMAVATFLMLTALGLYAWGKRQKRAALGCAAATLWVAHPIARNLGAAAYVDIGLTCFVFLGVYALRIFWDKRNPSWWYLGMALFAMAAGTKMTGLFFVGVGALFGLLLLAPDWLRIVRHKSKEKDAASLLPLQPQFNWKSAALGCTLALLIMMPWYAFNSYNMGNPLWPLFTGGHSKVDFAASPLPGHAGLDPFGGIKKATLRNFLMVYIDFFRDPVRFNAPLNLTLFPLIVIWPLAWIVAVFNRSVRWWVLCTLSFTLFWFLTVPLIRYWLPVVPIAGLALCEAIQWILERIRWPATLQKGVWVAASVLLLVWTSYRLDREIDVRGLPPATRQAREEFLNILNGYAGVRYVNAHADKNDTVCVMRAYWLNYFFKQRILDEAGKPKFRWPDDKPWLEWLDSQNVKWIVVDFQDRGLTIPKKNPVIDPFWPNFQIVYADNAIWVFQRKSVGGLASIRSD